MPTIIPNYRDSRAAHIESCCNKFTGLCGEAMRPELVKEPTPRRVCFRCGLLDAYFTCGVCSKRFAVV